MAFVKPCDRMETSALLGTARELRVRLLVESACKRRGCSFRPLAPRSSCFAMIVCFARVPCCRLAQREKHHPNTRISLCFVVLHSTRIRSNEPIRTVANDRATRALHMRENMHMQQQARRGASSANASSTARSTRTMHANQPATPGLQPASCLPRVPMPPPPPLPPPSWLTTQVCGARCSCVDALPRCCGPPPSRRVLDELSVLQRPPRRLDRRCPSSSSSLSSHHDASESRSTAWSQ